jgi:hypothetical protein
MLYWKLDYASGAPGGKRNGNYRHGPRTKAIIELWRFIKSLR